MTKLMRTMFASITALMLMFTPFVPLLEVLAEEPSPMSSVILDPGEGVFIKRNYESKTGDIRCNYYVGHNEWEYNLKLTPIQGELNYAFISRSGGNLLDTEGKRIPDEEIINETDYAKGGMNYQKHLTNPNLKFFAGELLNVTNTSEYPMKIEWITKGEHDSLIYPWYYDSGYRDCGLIVEDLNIPALKEYTIEPNEVYEFIRKPVKWDNHDLFLHSEFENSKILHLNFSNYIATLITSEGDMKFDVAVSSYEHGSNASGYWSSRVSETPVVITEAHKRYGHDNEGKYYLKWNTSSFWSGGEYRAV